MIKVHLKFLTLVPFEIGSKNAYTTLIMRLNLWNKLDSFTPSLVNELLTFEGWITRGSNNKGNNNNNKA